MWMATDHEAKANAMDQEAKFIGRMIEKSEISRKEK
jgi:hypothetical protein